MEKYHNQRPADPKRVVVRMNRELISALDRLVATRSASLPGLSVSRADVVRTVLLAALAENALAT